MRWFENKYFLLGVLAIIWGTSFILIKKAVEVYSPYQVGALRVGLAGLVLLPLGIPALRSLPKKVLGKVALVGFTGNFLPMFLFPMAEVKVSSSLAGILNSLVPVFVLIFGALIFHQKNTAKQWLGALIGFLGAWVLMSQSHSGDTSENIKYAMLIVLATASYAISGLLVKSYLTHIPSLKLSSAVFSVWFIPSLLVLLATQFFNDFNGTQLQWQGFGYVSILALVGTAGAMILFYKLIQQSSAVFASSVTYLMPIVAVIWGIAAGETFTIYYVIGGLLILLGVYLIRERKK